MKIGASTLCYLNTPFEGAMEDLVKLGFTTIEIFADSPSLDPMDLERGRLEWIRAMREQHGLTYTIHTPCFDVNPGSINRGIRQETVRQYTRTLELAREIEAELVVVHAGSLADPKLTPESGQAAMFETLAPVTDTAERLGVTLGFENTGYGSAGFIRSLEEWIELGRRLDSDRVTYLLDTGHAYLQGIDLGEAVRTIGPRLGQIHVHDTAGQKDDHLPVGNGVIDFRPMMQALVDTGHGTLLMLETCDADDPGRGVTDSRERLLAMLPSSPPAVESPAT